MAGEQTKAMLAGIENLWACFDELLGDIEASGRWGEKHGNDWTFGDVPYHMAYFDRELVANALERGSNVPTEEQRTQRTLRELNAWNAAQFAKRAAGQTPWQSVEEWHGVRDRIRAKVSSMPDEQLSEPVWIPLVGCGWLPAAASIGSCLAHTWSEFVQLRHHMGRSEPEPLLQATHAASGFLQEFLPAFVNREKAKEARLTLVIELTGPGGGAWTLWVADGKCRVSEERAADADLVISQSPETAELVRQGKIDFGEAMQSGAIQVQGAEHLATFGELFPEPSLDTEFPPAGPGARDND